MKPRLPTPRAISSPFSPPHFPKLPLSPVQSSNLKACAYDNISQHLQVQFKDGSTYDYPNVPPAAYQGLIASRSKGKFFDEAIRPRFRSFKRPPIS